MPDIKPPHRPDPYFSHNFYVEWNGIIHAGFRECSGLNVSQTPVVYREGTDPANVRKIPGITTYENISLRRGTTNNDELWQWKAKIMKGEVERREVSIVLLDETGKEKIRWNLTNCWPVTWSISELDAGNNALSIERIELAYEGVTVDKWS